MQTLGIYRTGEFQDDAHAKGAMLPHFIFHWGNRRTRLTIESILLALAIMLAAIWFAPPRFAREYINRGLSGLPDYTGRVERVRIRPWTASVNIYDFHIDKKTGEIPVHFFYSPRWNISLQWSQLFHGVERASVIIFDPKINLVAGPDSDQSQIGISGVWIDAVKALIPWRVNQIRIHHGDIHFLDFQTNPQVDLEISLLELAAENMSNSKGPKVPLPATIKTLKDFAVWAYQVNPAEVSIGEPVDVSKRLDGVLEVRSV